MVIVTLFRKSSLMDKRLTRIKIAQTFLKTNDLRENFSRG